MRLLLRLEGLEEFDALLDNLVEIGFVFGMRRSHGEGGKEAERGGEGRLGEEKESRMKRIVTAESKRESAFLQTKCLQVQKANQEAAEM